MFYSPFGDAMFTIVPVIIGIGFVVVIGGIIAAVVRGGMGVEQE